MKKLVIFSLLFLVSCSTSKPILMGSGSFTGHQISSCISHLFMINLGQRHHLRLDYLMNKYKLDQKDIYTVEFSETNFLGPLYQEKCLEISLNENASKKNTPHDSVPF